MSGEASKPAKKADADGKIAAKNAKTSDTTTTVEKDKPKGSPNQQLLAEEQNNQVDSEKKGETSNQTLLVKRGSNHQANSETIQQKSNLEAKKSLKGNDQVSKIPSEEKEDSKEIVKTKGSEKDSSKRKSSQKVGEVKAEAKNVAKDPKTKAKSSGKTVEDRTADLNEPEGKVKANSEVNISGTNDPQKVLSEKDQLEKIEDQSKELLLREEELESKDSVNVTRKKKLGSVVSNSSFLSAGQTSEEQAKELQLREKAYESKDSVRVTRKKRSGRVVSTSSLQSASQTKDEQSKKGSHNLSPETRRKLREIGQENKELQARRLQRFTSKEEQFVKQTQEELAGKQSQLHEERLQHRELVQKQYEELLQKKSERADKMKAAEEQYQQISKSKPLYQGMLEHFKSRMTNELGERKKTLATIRELAKPIDYEQLKARQAQYDNQKKLREQQSPEKNESAWVYQKPAFTSKIYEQLVLEHESVDKTEQIKQQKHAIQVLERRKNFGKSVTENHMPKADSQKQLELQQEMKKFFTKPRNQRERSSVFQEGNHFLSVAFSKHDRRTTHDKLNHTEESFGASENMFLTDIQEKNAQTISSSKKNKRYNSGDSTYGVTGKLHNLLSQSVASNDDPQKQIDFSQLKFMKALGGSYMETASKRTKKNQLNQSASMPGSHLVSAEIHRQIQENNNSHAVKVMSVQNIMRPFDEKINREQKLLVLNPNNDKVREEVADGYLTSINAKLQIIQSLAGANQKSFS